MEDPTTEETDSESEKIVAPTPRHIVDMQHDISRINELIDSIQRFAKARRKIEDLDFAELRERIARLPLPKS